MKNFKSTPLAKFSRISGSIVIAIIATFAIFVMMHRLIQFEGEAVVQPPLIALESIVFEEKDEGVREDRRPKPKPPQVELPKVTRIIPDDNIDPTVIGFDDKVIEIETDDIGKGFSLSVPDTETRPIVRFPPNYPSGPARDGIEGWVQLQFSVDEKGEVFDVTVVNAEPKRLFDREAKKALKRWKYQPKVVNGKAMIQTGLSVMLDFKLDQ